MPTWKISNLVLLLTSLVGYLAWGTDQHAFLFQAEAEVLYKLVTSPASALHPLTLIPMAGQVLLLIAFFRKHAVKWMTFAGIGAIGILLVVIFLVGLLGRNLLVSASALPFLVTAAWTIRLYRKLPPAGR